MGEATSVPALHTCHDEPLSNQLEAQLDAALEDAKRHIPGPAVTRVEYVSELQAIAVVINTGQRLLIPVEDMQYLGDARPEQLLETEIVGHGDGIGFPALDAYFSTEGLLAGRYGNKTWMKQLAAKSVLNLERPHINLSVYEVMTRKSNEVS